ncbi:hypothetical protein [Streptomyces sp. NPDC026673]|uniref:hypothetical protein n=1 Tax=Streptomyces sp. NPDC026673 TaxID=3155724 RepID=UPI0033F01964
MHGTDRDGARRTSVAAERGCGAAALFGLALFLVLVAFAGTTEMESFPGLRDNRVQFVVYTCAIAVLAAAGVFGVLGRRSRAALVLAVCVAALVAWRLWTIAPAFPCWSHDTVSRDDDGSYRCLDRWSG